MIGRTIAVVVVLVGMALSGCATTRGSVAWERDADDTLGVVVVGGLLAAAVVGLALAGEDDCHHHHDHDGGRRHR